MHNLCRALSEPARLAGFCFIAMMSGVGSTPAAAQDFSSSFGGFATNSNAPINIESDSLVVNDAKKTAVFKGNVVAVQGDMEMRTPELEVSYSGQVAGDGKGGTQLTHLRAKKKVLLISQNNQTATSDWADFDVKRQVITIGGNVVVSQGKNIMKGEKLIIDLKTGQSRMETAANSRSGSRVRGVFHPQNKPDAAKKQGGGSKKPNAVVDGWRATN